MEIVLKYNTVFLTEDPTNFKDKIVSYILIWTILCDPLHTQKNWMEKDVTVHSISQTFDTSDGQICLFVYNFFWLKSDFKWHVF